ncbi:MAG: DUF262 domain-containing protein [Candidatus Nanoarchaeia archaeon]|nr:DUF262 domain-containing protein [Candidatus Nanoarchaeia archaeon]
MEFKRNKDNKINFNDLPKFDIKNPNYKVNIRWIDFKEHYIEDNKLNINPDYQREHVWTTKQRIKYIEYILKGGQSGKDIYANHPNWMGSFKGDFSLVDGKQRVTTVLMFLDNEFPIFENVYCRDINRLPNDAEFIFHVNNLKTKKEEMQWYIDMNNGGTAHTDEEIEKVKKMIEKIN